MGQFPTPPPSERPMWLTFLKFIGVVVVAIFVIGLVLVGFIFFTCTRH